MTQKKEKVKHTVMHNPGTHDWTSYNSLTGWIPAGKQIN